MDSNLRLEAEKIIDRNCHGQQESSTISEKGCAACHILYRMKETLQISGQDAADLLSEILLDSRPLNDRFISMVEDIHMKSHMMGIIFAIKT